MTKLRLFKFLALTSVLATLSYGQFGLGKKDAKEKEAKSDNKNLQRYEKVKQYSLDKYQSDLDFRDEVEEAYQDLMRDHSDRAFNRNTKVSSRIAVVREDRWRIHENLYDNLLVQDQINRIGQSLVPKESERSFAFKVIPEPTPLAETLATGTIYISTGLISMLESEAQLAYVLGHEMAHVQLDHWKERVTLETGQKAYAEEQAKKQQKVALIGTLLGAGLAGVAGAKSGAGTVGTLYSANAGANLGALAGAAFGMIMFRPLIVSWDKVEEDAADDMAFKAVLNSSYDVREVPALYATMLKVVTRDARVGLGFLGNRHRVDQRLEHANTLISSTYKVDIETRLKTGFVSASAEHRNLMAELKRDNGIMAYYNDMFDMARANLAEATKTRANDPAAHYYYGKILKLVGRTPEEQKQARDEFLLAAKYDVRDENFGSHLHAALMMARDRDADRVQIAHELDTYVTDYARWNVMDRILATFPPNLETIYEYMTLYGDTKWWPKAPDVKDLLERYDMVNSGLPSSTRTAAPTNPNADKPAKPAGQEEKPPSPLRNLVPPGVQVPPSVVIPKKK